MLVARPPPEGEEGVGVAGGPVAEAGRVWIGPASHTSRPAARSSSLHCSSSGAQSQREVAHQAAPWHHCTRIRSLCCQRVAGAGRPVRETVFDDRQARQRRDRAALNLRASVRREKRATSEQHVKVADQPVRGADVPRLVLAESLRPEPRVQGFVVAPLLEEAHRPGRPELGPALLSRPRVELRGERHVSRMPEHDVERRRVERRACQLGEPVSASRVGPMPLGHGEHARDPEPDSPGLPVQGIGLGKDPRLERFDELPIGQSGSSSASAQAIPAAPW